MMGAASCNLPPLVVSGEKWGGVDVSRRSLGEGGSRPSARITCSNVDPERFRGDQFVKILVIGSCQLIAEILICEPDFPRTNTVLHYKTVIVAFSVVYNRHPSNLFKRFLPFPKRKIALRIGR